MLKFFLFYFLCSLVGTLQYSCVSKCPSSCTNSIYSTSTTPCASNKNQFMSYSDFSQKILMYNLSIDYSLLVNIPNYTSQIDDNSLKHLPTILNGTNGVNGVNGVNGIDGINGIDGKNGTNGFDCSTNNNLIYLTVACPTFCFISFIANIVLCLQIKKQQMPIANSTFQQTKQSKKSKKINKKQLTISNQTIMFTVTDDFGEQNQQQKVMK